MKKAASQGSDIGKRPKLLVVDDDEGIRLSLKWALSNEYELFLAPDGDQGLELFKREQPNLVSLDLGLPPDPGGTEAGFKALEAFLEVNQAAKIVVITGQDQKENAIKAIGMGAYDFFSKPIQVEELKIILRRAAYVSRLEEEHGRLQKLLVEKSHGQMIGTSPQIREIFSTIEKVAGTEVPVLILGESGTGKELVAKAIHEKSLRSKGPFVAINCGAIPENLLESELFGNEKGAFTGAYTQRRGRIESAEGGSLFLDEIGELPLGLQVKLLRFLQERKIERIGGRKEIFVDTRVISATNKDLLKQMEDKNFREDLYYRIGVVIIGIPPLRERLEDISLLSNWFLKRYADESRKKLIGFTGEAIRAAQEHPWPGNIRELENRIRRAVIMASGSKVTEADLQLGASTLNGKITLKEARENLERNLIKQSLIMNSHNMSRAAVDLGISRPTLYELMEKLGIKR